MQLPRSGSRRVARALPPLILAAACSSASAPIPIGIAGPFTDSVGAPMKRAAELAVEQINLAGDVGGRPIVLIARDDYGDQDSAVSAAAQLVGAGVVAVIGHVYSGTTLASAPVYNAARVLQISPASSAPQVTGAGEFTFRICPSDLQQGAALARFAAERLQLRRGTVLYSNDEYGRGLRQMFASEFSRLGGAIDETSPFLGTRPNLNPYLERLIRAGTSEFVFLGANASEGEAALRAARARGITLPVLGGDGLEGIEERGSFAEGTYISSAYLPSFDTPRNREFLAAYSARYPTARPPNQSAAGAWDAVFLLRDALARAGVDRERLRAVVAAIGRGEPAFQGVTGEIAFDENGDVPHQQVIIGRVERGHIRALEGL